MTCCGTGTSLKRRNAGAATTSVVITAEWQQAIPMLQQTPLQAPSPCRLSVFAATTVKADAAAVGALIADFTSVMDVVSTTTRMDLSGGVARS